MSSPRQSRPFLDVRIGGLRLTVQRSPRWLFLLVSSIFGAWSSVLTLRR